MDLDRLATFCAAADASSLSQAATRLGVPVSTVSRRVQDLEVELQAKLFERTGRGVRLSGHGRAFLPTAREVVARLEQARAELRSTPAQLEALKLSVPPDVASQLMPRAVAAVVRRHPQLSLVVRAEARRVSVVEEAYDAAVRLGALAPSELIARRLGQVSLGLFAPVTKLPEGPVVASTHRSIRVDGVPTVVQAREGGRRVELVFDGGLVTGTFMEAAELAVLTGRVVLLPSFSAARFVAERKLVRLPALTFAPVPMHLMRAPRHRGSVVLNELGQALQASLAEVERVVLGSRPVR